MKTVKNPILLQGGLLIDPASEREEICDIRISGSLITAIEPTLDPGVDETVIDAKGLWICPGFIDLHTHLRDLGQKDKEDIDSGTRAAAAGGFTTVVAMANTDPPLDNATTLAVLLKTIKEKAHIEVLPVASVTRGLEGSELTNMADLAEMGAVAFSDDGMTISNLAVLKRALEYARLSQRVIISHAEDRDLSAGGAIHEGVTATCKGLHGISAASETAAVAREIEIVRLTDAPYHFTHLSCAQSVDLVRRAKEDGLPITADVTPHHLTLTVDEIPGYDTNYKMKPPLRLSTDQAALIAGLLDGTIDAIATDHAPHTRIEKDTTMDDAAVGIIGLETAFALCHERLVKTGILTNMQLISLFTTSAARVLDLPTPTVQSGADANIAVFHPTYNWTYDVTAGLSKSRNSPYNGRLLTGKNIMTIYRGKPVYLDDTLLATLVKK